MQFYENLLRKYFVISRHYDAFIAPYFSTAKIILQSSQAHKAFLLRYEVQYRLLRKLRKFDIPFLYPYQLFAHHFTAGTNFCIFAFLVSKLLPTTGKHNHLLPLRVSTLALFYKQYECSHGFQSKDFFLKRYLNFLLVSGEITC